MSRIKDTFEKSSNARIIAGSVFSGAYVGLHDLADAFISQDFIQSGAKIASLFFCSKALLEINIVENKIDYLTVFFGAAFGSGVYLLANDLILK